MNFIECHKIRSLNGVGGEIVDVSRETCLNDGEILSVYCSVEKKMSLDNQYNKKNIHMMYVREFF